MRESAGCGALILVALLAFGSINWALIGQALMALVIIGLIALVVLLVAYFIAWRNDKLPAPPFMGTETMSSRSDNHFHTDSVRYPAFRGSPPSAVQRGRYNGQARATTRNDGRAYELLVASQMRLEGYEATVTPPGADYGVDIVAKRYGCVVVVQTKDYANTVGVKAVQEIFAARSHAGADEAWVVTPHGYSKPARTLAESTGVKLLIDSPLRPA